MTLEIKQAFRQVHTQNSTWFSRAARHLRQFFGRPSAKKGVDELYKYFKRSNMSFELDDTVEMMPHAPVGAADDEVAVAGGAGQQKSSESSATYLQLSSVHYVEELRLAYQAKLGEAVRLIENLLTSSDSAKIKNYLNSGDVSPLLDDSSHDEKAKAWIIYYLKINKGEVDRAYDHAKSQLEELEQRINAALVDCESTQLLSINHEKLLKAEQALNSNDITITETTQRDKADRKLRLSCQRMAWWSSIGLAVGEGVVPGAAIFFFLAAVNLPGAIAAGVLIGAAGFIANKLLIESDAEGILYAFRKRVNVGSPEKPRWVRSLFVDADGNEISRSLKAFLNVSLLLSLGAGLSYGGLAGHALFSVTSEALIGFGLTKGAAIGIAAAMMIFPVATVVGITSIFGYVIFDLVKHKKWESAREYIQTKYFSAPWAHMSTDERSIHVVSCVFDFVKQMTAVAIAITVAVIGFPIFRSNVSAAVTGVYLGVNRVFGATRVVIGGIAKTIGLVAASINVGIASVFSIKHTLNLFAGITMRGVVKSLASAPILVVDLALSAATLRFARAPLGLMSTKETFIQEKAIHWVGEKVDKLFKYVGKKFKSMVSSSGSANAAVDSDAAKPNLIKPTTSRILKQIKSDKRAVGSACAFNAAGQSLLFSTGGNAIGAKQVGSMMTHGHGMWGLTLKFFCGYIYSYGPNVIAGGERKGGGRVKLTSDEVRPEDQVPPPETVTI